MGDQLLTTKEVEHLVQLNRVTIYRLIRTEGFPALGAWYDRVTARKGFTKALPAKSAELLYKRDFYEAWDG